MKTKQEGFYAINGNRIIVGDGQIVSYPDDAIIEEFETITELDEKYPEIKEEDIEIWLHQNNLQEVNNIHKLI